MNRNNDRYILLIIFMFLGVVVSLQFRTILYNTDKTSTATQIEELSAQLEKEKDKEARLRESIKVNEDKQETYLKNIIDSKHDDNLKQLIAKRDMTRLKAGLTDVQGAGIIIKLDDGPAKINEDPRLLIIHDSDIVTVLNELKNAGAQAISINGERIISMSEQVCAGPTVRINKNRYAVPFVISAIGDPNSLYEGVSNSAAVAFMLRDKVKVEISKSDNIIIPAYNNNNDSFDLEAEVE